MIGDLACSFRFDRQPAAGHRIPLERSLVEQEQANGGVNVVQGQTSESLRTPKVYPLAALSQIAATRAEERHQSRITQLRAIEVILCIHFHKE
jgi:hypothetical protein